MKINKILKKIAKRIDRFTERFINTERANEIDGLAERLLDKIENKRTERKLKKKEQIITRTRLTLIHFMIMLMIYTLVGMGAINAEDGDENLGNFNSETKKETVEVTAENTLKPELHGSVTIKKEEDVQDIEQKKEYYKDDYGLIEGLVVNAVLGLADFLFDTTEYGLKLLGMQSIDKLILVQAPPDNFNFILTLFTEEELDQVVLKLFGLATGVFLMLIPNVVMKEGYVIAGSKGDSEKLAKAYRTFVSIIASLLMVAFSLWFVNIMFMCNCGLVSAFANMFDIFSEGSFSFSSNSSAEIYEIISKSSDSNVVEFANTVAKDQGNAFLSIVIRGAILVQTLIINVIYKFRRFFLLFLIGFLPFPCFGYIFDGYKPKTIETITEIASNIFTQSIHALFYSISIKFITLGSWGGLDIIVSLFMMTHVTDLIKSLLGANTSTSRIAQSMGMATAIGGLALLRGNMNNSEDSKNKKGENASDSTNDQAEESSSSSESASPRDFKSFGAAVARKSFGAAVRTTSKVGSIAIGASMIGTGNAGAAIGGIYGASMAESKIREGVSGVSKKGKEIYNQGLETLNQKVEEKKATINRLTTDGYRNSGDNINTRNAEETNVASFLR